MEIGAACALAKIPRPGLVGNGEARFCQVYGVRDQQKRKRHEICAAIDGNSLNIYEVDFNK